MRRVLRTPAAAEYIGYKPSTLEKMRVYGGGPRFVKLGERAVGYDIEDLDSFIEERRRVSTSDPGGTIHEAAAAPPVADAGSRQTSPPAKRPRAPKTNKVIAAVDEQADRRPRSQTHRRPVAASHHAAARTANTASAT
jgi:predicted DNA-binding transcriptional regulator AlpA